MLYRGDDPMAKRLELSEGEFTRVAAAFAPFRLGDEVPPYFRAYLVRKLSPSEPVLARRIDAASAGSLERLFTQIRDGQFAA
jgi:hypothetical protein